MRPKRGDTLQVRSGVNLGGLFLPPRAIDQHPTFNQSTPSELPSPTISERLHVALVKINAPDTIDDKTLGGVGLTLTQLSRLGMTPIVVVDQPSEKISANHHETISGRRKRALHQADRVVEAIELHNSQGARRLDTIVGSLSGINESGASVPVQGQATILEPNLLLAPLRRGAIPVLTTVGYTQDHSLIHVPASEVILALTRNIAGISSATTEEDLQAPTTKNAAIQKALSLDRLIILDPNGGIPSSEKFGGSHVFINLEQEYSSVKKELSNISNSKTPCFPTPLSIASHLSNLQLARSTLALLSPSSSALVTTPRLASNSSDTSYSSTIGVSTRPHPSPLIHNILTDKPTFSSSLPISRLAPETSCSPRSQPPTFLKRGMPVTIFPDPRTTPWQPTNPIISLSDPQVDLPRLVHLIEDSFSRKLDVQHYLARLSTSLAGLIIAGSYEGCAILTWETPSSFSHLPPSQVPSSRLVPYLDKFAVLKKSQGAGGVADIVFNAMVSQCFPRGVAWRSRRENPVNKWYFERARGSWKITPREGDATRWTMFWTTEGLGPERFEDYEGVCRGVKPSWGDGKGAE